MSKVMILSQKTIEDVLDMRQVIEAVEQAYIMKSAGNAEVWPLVFYEFEPGRADMDIKSGYLKDTGIYGMKLVSWFGDNDKKGLPLLHGTTVVFDSHTGVPVGVLNAEYVTGMRTGAAGAIGAKYLARKDSESLLMVGAGHQAAFQIEATLIAMDHVKIVRIYDPMDSEKARKLCGVLKEKFNVVFEAVTDIAEAVGKSDIIITATPSRKPLIMKEWVRKGTHFSCVGADMEGKQEIDEDIFKDARVYVDDKAQAIHVGEVEIPIKKGVISEKDIIAEMGKVISGEAPARLSPEDITIYDTTGIALQDLITSKLALDLARQKGLGVEVDL